MAGQGKEKMKKVRKMRFLLLFTASVILLTAVPAWAGPLDSIKEFLANEVLYKTGIDVFNAFMDLGDNLLGINLVGTDLYTESETLRQVFTVTGVTLTNIFFLVAFVQEVADFKNQLTLEGGLTALLKLAALNIIFVKLQDILIWFLGLVGNLVSTVQGSEHLTDLVTEVSFDNVDFGSVSWGDLALFWIVGLFFFIACLIMGAIILWTIASAYLKIFFYLATSPLALSTIVGKGALSQTAYSWFKAFLCSCVELAAIVLVMRLGSNLFTFFPAGTDLVMTAIYAMASLVILSISAVGAERLIRRGFNL